LWNLMVHYRVDKSRPQNPFLTQLNLVHILISSFSFVLMLSFHKRHSLPIVLFILGRLTGTVDLIICPIRTTRIHPACLILEFIVLVLFCEGQKVRSSSLYDFLC
jgi:hypothetical protein